MPTLIELRLKATWPVRPDVRQMHGLACALFEGEGAEHFGQEKPFAVWPLRPGSGRIGIRLAMASRVAAGRAPARRGAGGGHSACRPRQLRGD
jgi:hypothetical protein